MDGAFIGVSILENVLLQNNFKLGPERGLVYLFCQQKQEVIWSLILLNYWVCVNSTDKQICWIKSSVSV